MDLYVCLCVTLPAEEDNSLPLQTSKQIKSGEKRGRRRKKVQTNDLEVAALANKEESMENELREKKRTRCTSENKLSFNKQ
jgi:hypothetical protein